MLDCMATRYGAITNHNSVCAQITNIQKFSRTIVTCGAWAKFSRNVWTAESNTQIVNSCHIFQKEHRDTLSNCCTSLQITFLGDQWKSTVNAHIKRRRSTAKHTKPPAPNKKQRWIENAMTSCSMNIVNGSEQITWNLWRQSFRRRVGGQASAVSRRRYFIAACEPLRRQRKRWQV